MTLLIIVLALCSTCTAYLCYTSTVSDPIKIFILPLYFLIMWVGADYYTDQLGRPLYEKPDGTFTYITHVKIGNTIELIAADDVSSRLYVFVPSEQEEEALDKAEGKAEQGQELQGNFIGTKFIEGEGELEFWPVEEERK